MGTPSDRFSLAVVPSSGDVVVYDAAANLRRCNFLPEGKGEWEDMKWTCFHQRIMRSRWFQKLLPACLQAKVFHSLAPLFVSVVQVEGKNFLTVACNRCNDITSIDLQTKQKSIAYRFKPKSLAMCNGASGKLLLFLENGYVQELSGTLKDEKLKLIETGLKFQVEKDHVSEPCSMCYLPGPPDAVAVSSSSSVGVYYRKGKTAWRRMSPLVVDGMRVRPCGIAFSVRHNTLLLADGRNHCLLEFDPLDGSPLRKVPLKPIMPNYPILVSWSEDKEDREDPSDHLLVLGGRVKQKKAEGVLLRYEVPGPRAS